MSGARGVVDGQTGGPGGAMERWLNPLVARSEIDTAFGRADPRLRRAAGRLGLRPTWLDPI